MAVKLRTIPPRPLDFKREFESERTKEILKLTGIIKFKEFMKWNTTKEQSELQKLKKKQ